MMDRNRLSVRYEATHEWAYHTRELFFGPHFITKAARSLHIIYERVMTLASGDELLPFLLVSERPELG